MKAPALVQNGNAGTQRKDTMRLTLLLFSILSPALSQPVYKLVPDWPTEARTAAGTPAGPWNLIQAPGVAVDARGHVLVLHRGAHPILEFESGGKFVRSWGDGMFSEGTVVAVARGDRAPGASGHSAVYRPAGGGFFRARTARGGPAGDTCAGGAPR